MQTPSHDLIGCRSRAYPGTRLTDVVRRPDLAALHRGPGKQTLDLIFTFSMQRSSQPLAFEVHRELTV